jgi:hypothetical protein
MRARFCAMDASPFGGFWAFAPVGIRMALACSAVSEKSLFIQGILLTCISLPNQVCQSIVHVIDEWAKVALDTTGRAFGHSDCLSKDRSDLPTFRLCRRRVVTA